MTNQKFTNMEMPSCDDRLLWDILLSAYHFPVLSVADELGVFPLLAVTPFSATEFAKKLSLGARASETMLGILAALGFLAQRNNKFYITDVTRNFLLPDSPYYWGGMLQLARGVAVSHGMLREALLKDKPIGYGERSAWQTHEIDPNQAKVFTQAMHSHTFPAAMGIARRGNFEGVKKLIDVGGGSGCCSIAIASHHSEISCSVMDLPVVCKLAEKYIAQYELQERIGLTPLDMFNDPWPFGYDAVLFSNIFHDWSFARCAFLCKRSFDVLPPGGKIFVHEMLLADTKDYPLSAISFSMTMMFVTEGKQLTLKEIETFLYDAGFENVSTTITYGYYYLISANKPHK